MRSRLLRLTWLILVLVSLLPVGGGRVAAQSGGSWSDPADVFAEFLPGDELDFDTSADMTDGSEVITREAVAGFYYITADFTGCSGFFWDNGYHPYLADLSAVLVGGGSHGLSYQLSGDVSTGSVSLHLYFTNPYFETETDSYDFNIVFATNFSGCSTLEWHLYFVAPSQYFDAYSAEDQTFYGIGGGPYDLGDYDFVTLYEGDVINVLFNTFSLDQTNYPANPYLAFDVSNDDPGDPCYSALHLSFKRASGATDYVDFPYVILSQAIDPIVAIVPIVENNCWIYGAGLHHWILTYRITIDSGTPTPSPMVTPTATTYATAGTPTNTPAPTSTRTPGPTRTPIPTWTPVPSSTPRPPTATPGPTSTATPTRTPVPTSTPWPGDVTPMPVVIVWPTTDHSIPDINMTPRPAPAPGSFDEHWRDLQDEAAGHEPFASFQRGQEMIGSLSGELDDGFSALPAGGTACSMSGLAEWSQGVCLVFEATWPLPDYFRQASRVVAFLMLLRYLLTRVVGSRSEMVGQFMTAISSRENKKDK